MLSHYRLEDEEKKGIYTKNLKTYMQNLDQELIEILRSDDHYLKIASEVYSFIRNNIKTELEPYIERFENIEMIANIFKRLHNKFNLKAQELSLDKNIKLGLELILDWYQIRCIDIYLQPSIDFLSYPSDDEKVISQKKYFIDEVNRIKERIAKYNAELLVVERNYQVNVLLNLKIEDFQNLIEPLIKEEIVFDSGVEINSTIRTFKKEYKDLQVKLSKLTADLKQLAENINKRILDESNDRLKKINMITAPKLYKNTNLTELKYDVDPFYVPDFHQREDPQEKKAIEEYKRIMGENLEYDRIIAIKNVVDQLKLPLEDFKKKHTKFYEATYYFDIKSDYRKAINRIFDLLKNDSEYFIQNAAILKTMQEHHNRYEWIKNALPKHKEIAESDFLKLAAIYTKELYKKNLTEFRKISLQALHNREKAIFALMPVQLKITLHHIQPMKLEEIHRQKLNEIWIKIFKYTFNKEFSKYAVRFKQIKNKFDNKTLLEIQQMSDAIEHKRQEITGHCLLGLPKNIKTNIMNLLNDTFLELPIYQHIEEYLNKNINSARNFLPPKIEKPVELDPYQPQIVSKVTTKMWFKQQYIAFKKFILRCADQLKIFFKKVIDVVTFASYRAKSSKPKIASQKLNPSYKGMLKKMPVIEPLKPLELELSVEHEVDEGLARAENMLKKMEIDFNPKQSLRP